ncbi:MAG: DUF1318 domain-containing protein [Candidatus Omnitrophica bacterium]|nr:DUF1318 domain-containing protein [Candidatus Omnitrophota bacterium]
MIRKIVFTAFSCVLVLGCASVQVKAPKDPIKVDISMRLDVYQHVVQDIDAIESLVSGPAPGTITQSRLPFALDIAHADEGFGPEVEAAIASRRQRYSAVMELGSKGVLGENHLGLLEIRGTGPEAAKAAELASLENADRMKIYDAIARKNGTSVRDVQLVYAERMRKDAPAGMPVEEPKGYWKIK